MIATLSECGHLGSFTKIEWTSRSCTGMTSHTKKPTLISCIYFPQSIRNDKI